MTTPEEVAGRLEALVGLTNEVPRIPNLPREVMAEAASLIRSLEADKRSLEQRVEKLEGALADVLPYAERGAYLSEKCAFEYGDGYTQPYELTISWEWQQSKPYTGGWGALRSDTEAWVSELRESEADVAVVRARSALERP